jgi:hypothetical protein
MKLHAVVDRFGSWIRTIPVGRDTSRVEMEFWPATADKSGTLWFHPPDVPIRVWAITIQPAGVIWAESAIGRISENHVTVRCAGETARLDREKLWRHWGCGAASRSSQAAAAPRPASSMRSGKTAGDGPPARSEERASATRSGKGFVIGGQG